MKARPSIHRKPIGARHLLRSALIALPAIALLGACATTDSMPTAHDARVVEVASSDRVVNARWRPQPTAAACSYRCRRWRAPALRWPS